MREREKERKRRERENEEIESPVISIHSSFVDLLNRNTECEGVDRKRTENPEAGSEDFSFLINRATRRVRSQSRNPLLIRRLTCSERSFEWLRYSIAMKQTIASGPVVSDQNWISCLLQSRSKLSRFLHLTIHARQVTGGYSIR